MLAKVWELANSSRAGELPGSMKHSCSVSHCGAVRVRRQLCRCRCKFVRLVPPPTVQPLCSALLLFGWRCLSMKPHMHVPCCRLHAGFLDRLAFHKAMDLISIAQSGTDITRCGAAAAGDAAVLWLLY